MLATTVEDPQPAPIVQAEIDAAQLRGTAADSILPTDILAANLGPTAPGDAACFGNLITDTTTEFPSPDLPLPDYAAPFTDPVFGTRVIRVTDPGEPIPNLPETWETIARHHYSLDEAWNADQTLLMLDTGTPGNLYLDARTYEPRFIKPAPGPNRWHPTDPDLQIYVDDNKIGLWNVRTDVNTVVATIDGYSGFAFGPNKGNPSYDGTMIAVRAISPDGHDVAFAYNLQTQQKYPDIPMPAGSNSVTISPLGTYVVLHGDITGPAQTQVYDLQGNPVGPLWSEYHRPGHADLTVDENGDEVAVGVSKSDPDSGRVIKRRLKDGAITLLTDSGYASHTSARNVQRPGWVYVTYHDASSSWPPYHDEIVAVKLDGSMQVQRLVHTHAAEVEYSAEPHASPSPDGTKVIFASNWGDAGGPIAAYVVELCHDDTAGVTIRETGWSTDVSEGGASDTYTVVLDTQPGGDVTVTVSADAQSDVGNGPGAALDLTFTPSNWNVPETVTVAAVDDAKPEPTYTSTIRHASSSTDTDYDLLSIADVAVHITDNDAARMSQEVRVAASSDDAEERETGAVALTSTDLELVRDVSDQTVGMRFNGLNIPGEATITKAYIQFQVDEPSSVPTSLTIYGQATDDALTFTSSLGDISSRSRTTASVSWHPAPWTVIGQAGPDQQTPDIAPIIQQIVDRPGWSRGNSLVVIITGTGERAAAAYDGVPAGAALLRVEYVTPGVTVSQSGRVTEVTEGGATDTYTISLDTIPAGAVEITVSADPQSEVSLDGVHFGPAQTFARVDLTPQTITVRAVDDTVVEGAHNGRISQAITGTVLDPNYPRSLPITGVIAHITDNDQSATIVEDFESADFSTLPWQHDSTPLGPAWFISAPSELGFQVAHGGRYSAQAGAIYHSQNTSLEVTLTTGNGDISFWRKVSSERYYDYLRFYVDGAMQDQWSGGQDWAEVAYTVTAGEHTFLWEYSKDGSVSRYADTAWIDDILFPPTVPDTTPPAVEVIVPSPGATVTASSVSVSVTFSERVQGVDASDLQLSGIAAAAATVGTPNDQGGNTWQFPVTGLVDGPLNLSLAPDANDIQDLAGNDLAHQTWPYTVSISASRNVEDFETADFSKFPWQHDSTLLGHAWVISTPNESGSPLAHGGLYSAQAGRVFHGRKTSLKVTLTTGSGDISFWRKVSSEPRFDYLTFYVDGTTQDSWSGNLDWAKVAYTVTAGEHTFLWEYSKDGSVSRYADTAWIDDIVFPPIVPSLVVDEFGIPTEGSLDLGTGHALVRSEVVVPVGRDRIAPDDRAFGPMWPYAADRLMVELDTIMRSPRPAAATGVLKDAGLTKRTNESPISDLALEQFLQTGTPFDGLGSPPH